MNERMKVKHEKLKLIIIIKLSLGIYMQNISLAIKTILYAKIQVGLMVSSF